MESWGYEIEKYVVSGSGERFEYLCDHYSVLQAVIKNYREDLIVDVVEMKAYNRKAENGETEVRIKVSLGAARPTEKQALARKAIADAIDEGKLNDAFFEDTDDRQALIDRVNIYHAVSAGYKEIREKMDNLTEGERNILYPYLMRQKSLSTLAEELGVDYDSAYRKVYRIKKKLSDLVVPRLKKGEKKWHLEEQK